MDKEKLKRVEKKIFKLFIILTVLFFLTSLLEYVLFGKSKDSSIELNATIMFTETKFFITNENTFDWTNVEIEINPGIFKGGYKLTVDRVAAGQTYILKTLQFTKRDEIKFNPLKNKPHNILIKCDTSYGKMKYCEEYLRWAEEI
ncbi:MAG: hypothetical protein JW983_09905 [Elusimicrobia bacterium]|nr:hypothetical protein [Elusimicrobiota bacterium]